uniref:Xaa-Pro aminopeptidase 1 n=1 Tax=Lygus hesperus TaxID=30085 RepID=A0A0K8S9Q9_LYGHE
MKVLYILMSLVWMVEGRGGQQSQKHGGYPRSACPPSDDDPQPQQRIDTSDVLTRFRQEMAKTTSRAEKFDAYLVPGSDAHQSSILAERDKRIQYLSGFTGNKAMAILTQDKAAIWVDPYDAEQADEEVSCDWAIYTNSKNDVSIPLWIQMNLRARSRIGVDASLISQSQWEILSKRVTLVPVRNNLVDLIWANRPQYENYKATPLAPPLGLMQWSSKIARVREALRNESCDMLLVTALDEICWVLNLRGKETEYLPVIRAYLVITDKVIYLYTNISKIGDVANGVLKADNCYSATCVRLIPYENVWGDLKTMSSQIWKKVWFPSDAPFLPGGSHAIYDIIQADKISKVSPIALMKAAKNEDERMGMSNAHVRDAVAFCDFMAYLGNQMKAGEEWDEHKAAMTLDDFRRQQPMSEGISFKTVVAFGAHSALPHYRTNNITSLKINSSSVLLIDSGGQYTDGTTDLTRTFHLGKPTDEQINVYTRVLMGLIDLASATFPDSFTLQEADVLARGPLWDAGMDYGHPTGHGVGCYLSVEEGPLMISQDDHPKHKFKDGYFVTDGPGYYEEDQYGIRLENVLEVVPHPKNDTVRKLLTFRSATLVPFEPKLIDRKLLSPKQISWLNAYNTRIREEVGTELKKQMRMKGFYWMMEKAQVIPDARCSATNLYCSHLSFLVTSISVLALICR